VAPERPARAAQDGGGRVLAVRWLRRELQSQERTNQCDRPHDHGYARGPPRKRHVPEARVPVETLDACIEPGTRINLAKIDAEGYEPKILAGAQRVLAENPDLVMVLEVNLLIWRMFSNPRAVLGGYMGDSHEIFAIRHDGRIVPHGDAVSFLDNVDDAFVAYCLIAPKTANMAKRFAAKVVR
jgi:hypothetical protein